MADKESDLDLDNIYEDTVPTSKAAITKYGGYNQTYVVLKDSYAGIGSDSKSSDGHEVFFRCGNWCYKGQIQFNGLRMSTSDLPIIIPVLQKQQGSLRYYCNSVNIPAKSDFYDPLIFLNDALDFVGGQMMSEAVEKELKKMSAVFPWIDDENASTYFELALANVPTYMDKVALVATKTYTRGLIVISVFFESSVYFVLQSGEGDQPLLDVRFPDISKHGQGLHLASYPGEAKSSWRKLTLWHILFPETTPLALKDVPKLKTISISSKNYEQTYCIMKSSWDTSAPALSVHHDVLFRFGSWCYSGRVQLTPQLALADIPFVIPALRMQQNRLDFVCEAGAVPTTSPFAGVLGYVSRIMPHLEAEIAASEEVLRSLIDRLSKMGLGESVNSWLTGDPTNSFFEFKVAADPQMAEAFAQMELVTSKCYHASGIITITIIFQFSIYVCVLDGGNENPLLDSRFPDVSGKGRGYQIQAYEDGVRGWEQLRKVSLWQTVGALEREFKDRAAQLGASQAKEECDEASLLSRGEDEKPGAGAAATSSCNASSVAESKDASLCDDTRIRERKGGSAAEPQSGFESPKSRATAEVAPRDDRFASHRSEARTPAQVRTMSLRADIEQEAGPQQDGFAMGALASSLGGSKEDSPGAQADPFPRRLNMARPHHLPKLDSATALPMARKLEELRSSLSSGDADAPWDASGKPLQLLGSKK